jgi:hypothetical protein
MSSFRNLNRAFRRYVSHPDKRVSAANFIAMLVASNQPFYPLYLYWMVTETVWPAFATFLSTPLFLLVPALSRRNSLAGRALLPLTGILNTILSARMFGVASGVEVFLIPCALLALLLFRPSERRYAYPLAAGAFLVFLALHDRYGAPAHLYSAGEYAAFIRLNAMSAAALCA